MSRPIAENLRRIAPAPGGEPSAARDSRGRLRPARAAPRRRPAGERCRRGRSSGARRRRVAGSNRTGVARCDPRESSTCGSWIPATTCALVTTRPVPATKPDPVWMPPHPTPTIRTVDACARSTAACTTAFPGTSIGPAGIGSIPSNTRGNGVTEMNCCTRENTLGAGGRCSTSARTITDRLIARETSLRRSGRQQDRDQPDRRERREDGDDRAHRSVEHAELQPLQRAPRMRADVATGARRRSARGRGTSRAR